jgi:hypothetical protein
MSSASSYQLLADAVLVLHFAIVVFVVGGLVLVVAGNVLGWRWVNGWWFRLAHAAAIGIVVVQAWLGRICPLTTLESWLRTQAGSPPYGESFVEHLIHRVLYYDFPAWAFALAYSVFGLLVAAIWWYFPPHATVLPASRRTSMISSLVTDGSGSKADTMENEVLDLLDRTRVIETINRLFIGTDDRDWSLVRSCFAPRVLFDMSSLGAGPAKETTPAEIVAGWEAGLKPIKAVHHQVGNHVVRVLGDRAEAFCYGIATHYLPNRTNANTRTFVGSYDFELSRTSATWVITKFRFNVKYVDGNLDLEKS